MGRTVFGLGGHNGTNALSAGDLFNFATLGRAPLGNWAVAPTTAANFTSTLRIAGTISNLSAGISTAGSYASDITYTLQKNGADTSLSITIPSGKNGFYTDYSHTVHYAAGDTLSIKATVASGITLSSTVAITCLTMAFLPDSGTSQAVSCVGPQSIGPGPGTVYFPLTGIVGLLGTESIVQTSVPIAGTLKDMGINVDTNTSSVTNTFVSRINGATGNLSVSFAAGAFGYAEDTTHTDVITAGALVDTLLSLSASTGAIDIEAIQSHFVSGTEGLSFLGSHPSSSSTLNPNFTHWVMLTGAGNVGTSKDRTIGLMPFACTLSNLTVYCDSNANNGTTTATVMANGSTTSLQASIAAGAFGISTDSTHTAAYLLGDSQFVQYDCAGGSTGNVGVEGVSVQVQDNTGLQKYVAL